MLHIPPDHHNHLRQQIFLFSIFLVCIFLSALLINHSTIDLLRSQLKKTLYSRLTADIPPASGRIQPDVIYIMGGSPKSQKYKYRLAAQFYAQNPQTHVWILHRSGKTKYSHTLARNFTNDEWAVRSLVKQGIPASHIEAISIEEGYLGTYSEAKTISHLITEEKLNSILVISSPHHAQRVKISFQHFLRHQDIAFYFQGSREKVRLRILITEYCKLLLYHLVMLIS